MQTPIQFRAIAMMSDSYGGCVVRVKAQGLRWSSRDGRFGCEHVIARDLSTGEAVQFQIGRHHSAKGCIESPNAEQASIFARLQAAGVLI